jgi:hypothetical protein
MGRLFMFLFVLLIMAFVACFIRLAWKAVENEAKKNTKDGDIEKPRNLKPYITTLLICGAVTSICIGILDHLALGGWMQLGVLCLGISSFLGISSRIRRKSILKMEWEKLTSGNRADILEVLDGAQTRLRKIRRFAQSEQCPRLKGILTSIEESGWSLVRELTSRPDDILSSQPFLESYLDTTNAIMQRYIAIEDQSKKDALFVEIQPALVDLDKAFAMKVGKFKRREEFELGVDIKHLKYQLRGDGYGK